MDDQMTASFLCRILLPTGVWLALRHCAEGFLRRPLGLEETLLTPEPPEQRMLEAPT
jgi:hypothetical protein